MKVIFLKDVPRVGRKHDLKEVADGYALNNLIPRKLAVPATPEHIRRVATERSAQASSSAAQETRVRELSSKTKETPIAIQVVANEKGHLFKGVHASDIINAIRKDHGVTLTEKEIEAPESIKEVGLYTIHVTVGGYRGECIISIQKA